MPENLIDQGINLMLVGVSIVFVFLTLLVITTRLMSSIVNRLTTEENSVTESAAQMPSGAQTSTPLPQPVVLQAIKLAIAEHRTRSS